MEKKDNIEEDASYLSLLETVREKKIFIKNVILGNYDEKYYNELISLIGYWSINDDKLVITKDYRPNYLFLLKANNIFSEAMYEGNFKLANYLFEKRYLNLLGTDLIGNSILDICTTSKKILFVEQEEIVEHIINYDKDVLNVINSRGFTPIMNLIYLYCIEINNKETIKEYEYFINLFYDKGADINKLKNKETILDIISKEPVNAEYTIIYDKLREKFGALKADEVLNKNQKALYRKGTYPAITKPNIKGSSYRGKSFFSSLF